MNFKPLKTKKQYEVTKSAAQSFKEALEKKQNTKSNLPPVLAKAEVDGIKSVLETLNAEIKDYEKRNNKPSL